MPKRNTYYVSWWQVDGLTILKKKENRELARQRISVEHVNRMMKIFLILKHPYRNKQKRFGLRVNLLAAIYNKNMKKQ